LRRRSDRSDRRQPDQSDQLVRQRMGLQQPHRRPDHPAREDVVISKLRRQPTWPTLISRDTSGIQTSMTGAFFQLKVPRTEPSFESAASVDGFLSLSFQASMQSE